MTDPAQISLHTDSNTFFNELLKDAEDLNGDAMYLDSAQDDVSVGDVEVGEVLNDLEEVE